MAKIRSQYDYKGAIAFVNSRRMYVNNWKEYCDIRWNSCRKEGK